jgi:hypothetical protein
MRGIPFVFATTVLLAFVAQADEPVATPTAPAAVTAPSPPANATQGTAVISGPPASPAVAAPVTRESATAAGEGTVAPASAASAAPQSEPITLKMATVAPPADFKPPPGYRVVKRGLDTVYCKSVTPTGTKLPQTVCMSQEQLEAEQRQTEASRQMLRERAHPGATSGGG